MSGFAVTEARVSPERARFGGRPLRLRLVFRAAAPLDLRVVIRRAGRTVRRWELAGAAPGVPQRLRWTGLTSAGSPARDGRYRVRAGPAGGRLRAAGSFVLRGHVYPVRGGHWFRGPVGSFGAPRNGGRTHEGFDINATTGDKPPDQMRFMMRSLLRDRFKLTFHSEKRELPTYALVVARSDGRCEASTLGV